MEVDPLVTSLKWVDVLSQPFLSAIHGFHGHFRRSISFELQHSG